MAESSECPERVRQEPEDLPTSSRILPHLAQATSNTLSRGIGDTMQVTVDGGIGYPEGRVEGEAKDLPWGKQHGILDGVCPPVPGILWGPPRAAVCPRVHTFIARPSVGSPPGRSAAALWPSPATRQPPARRLLPTHTYLLTTYRLLPIIMYYHQ